MILSFNELFTMTFLLFYQTSTTVAISKNFHKPAHGILNEIIGIPFKSRINIPVPAQFILVPVLFLFLKYRRSLVTLQKPCKLETFLGLLVRVARAMKQLEYLGVRIQIFESETEFLRSQIIKSFFQGGHTIIQEIGLDSLFKPQLGLLSRKYMLFSKIQRRPILQGQFL